MSDEIEPSDPLADIGILLFGRVIHATEVAEFCDEIFGTNPSCGACGKGTYSPELYAPYNDRTIVHISACYETDPESQKVITKLNTNLCMPAFYMFCERCGHVRYHTLAKVAEWLNMRDFQVNRND
jgi:hypothetical protein